MELNLELNKRAVEACLFIRAERGRIVKLLEPEPIDAWSEIDHDIVLRVASRYSVPAQPE
ncbi:MAG: hypothetical protein WD276_07350 [Actinomycetota bacterium]